MVLRGWILCIVCLIAGLNTGLAQTKQYAFRISFKDKQGAPPASNPIVFLSQRAIDRRAAQGIAVDSTDRPVSPIHLSNVLSLTGGVLHTTSRWLNNCVILLNDSADILQLQGEAYINNIKYIAYYSDGLHNMQEQGNGGNNWYPPMRITRSNATTATTRTTGTAAYYGSSFGQVQLVNGDYLHDHGYKGKGLLICVFDEGFTGVNSNIAFDTMNDNSRLLEAHNFVLNSTDVYNFGYHGTSAISAMAANMPGNYVGTAPDAEYAIYVTEDGSGEQEIEMDNLLAATERSDSLGADIISASLGYNTWDPPLHLNSLQQADLDGQGTIADKAANMATMKGILFVASAGNEGGTAWNKILTPGDADSAITIGSVDLNKAMAGSSGFGPNAAGRIKPDVCLVGNPAMVLATGTNAIPISGTSFAVPQLAGWAACLWQATGKSTAPYRLRTAINQSAHLAATPGFHTGYGVPDFKKALELLNVKDTPRLPSADNWLMVVPNPTASSQTNLKIFLTQTANVTYRITDIWGREIERHTHGPLFAGVTVLPIDAGRLQAGIYNITVTSRDKVGTVRFIRQ
jgi:Subtilisin-like serine proteases